MTLIVEEIEEGAIVGTMKDEEDHHLLKVTAGENGVEAETEGAVLLEGATLTMLTVVIIIVHQGRKEDPRQQKVMGTEGVNHVATMNMNRMMVQ